MDFPNPYLLPRSIPSYGSNYSGGRMVARLNASSNETGVSTSWTATSRVLIMPFWLPWPYPVRRVFWGNGATLTANKDFGIYTFDGGKIYTTGSVAEAGASALQYVTPTEFTLYPGRYYMAISCNAASTAGHAWAFAPSGFAMTQGGMLNMATTFPLPVTLTFATSSGTIVPLFGFTRYAS